MTSFHAWLLAAKILSRDGAVLHSEDSSFWSNIKLQLYLLYRINILEFSCSCELIVRIYHIFISIYWFKKINEGNELAPMNQLWKFDFFPGAVFMDKIHPLSDSLISQGWVQCIISCWMKSHMYSNLCSTRYLLQLGGWRRCGVKFSPCSLHMTTIVGIEPQTPYILVQHLNHSTMCSTRYSSLY